MSVHLDKKLFLVASLCDAVRNGAPGPSACLLGGKPFVCQQQSPAGRALLESPPRLRLGMVEASCYSLFEYRIQVNKNYRLSTL